MGYHEKIDMTGKNITFTVIHDIDKARELWNLLSTNETIDDTWEFRYSFYKYLYYNIYFIVGYDGNEPIGILPLQYNASYGLKPPYASRIDGYLEFFGGDDMDDNDLLLRSGYEAYAKLFIAEIDRQAILAPLSEKFKHFPYAQPYTYKYILPLSGYAHYEDFLMHRLDGDKRRNLQRQIRGLYRDHVIEVKENDGDDLSFLVTLSDKRFGEDSSFKWPYRPKIFEDLQKHYRSVSLSLIVDGKKEAVAFGIIYNGVYLDMNAVANPEIQNLGKLLTFIQMNKAIAIGCHTFDAGKGDSGWKEQFNFVRIPQYKIVLPDPTYTRVYNFLP